MELLYFDGCPGYRKAEWALRSALPGSGIQAEVKLDLVSTDEEAERLRFLGSPTVRVDGEDPFPKGLGRRTGWYLGCRIYQTPEGPTGHPLAEVFWPRLHWIEEELSNEERSSGPSR